MHVQNCCFANPNSLLFPVFITVNINWSLVSTVRTFDVLTFGTLDWENHVALKRIMKNIQIWLGFFRELVASISSVLVDQKLYARYFFLSEWRGGQPSVKSLKPVRRNDSGEETQDGSRQTGIVLLRILRPLIPSFQIDLFSLYVLSSQYRSCDNSLEPLVSFKFRLTHVHMYA